MSKVNLSVEVQIQEALAKFDVFGKKVNTSLNSIEGSVGSVSTILKSMVGLFAAEKLIEGFTKISEAAIEVEQSSFKMQNALRLTGELTDANVQHFEELAAQLSKNSTIDDDLILSQVALTKQFRTTNSEAERLIRAAVDLAAYTGQDLSSAVQQLGQTLDGTAGRIGQLIPELQFLSAEQLRAGDAIDVVSRKMGGTAAREAETFGGKIKQLKNEFGNFVEALGLTIVKSPQILGFINSLKDLMIELTASITNNGQSFNEIFVGSLNGLLAFGEGFTAVMFTVHQSIEVIWRDIKNLGSWLAGVPAMLKNLATGNLSTEEERLAKLDATFKANDQEGAARLSGWLKIGDAISKVKSGLEAATTSQKKFKEEVTQTAGVMTGPGARFDTELVKKGQEIVKDLGKISTNEIEKTISEYAEKIVAVNTAGLADFKNRQKYEVALGTLRVQMEKAVAEARRKEYDKSLKELQELTNDPTKFFYDRTKNNNAANLSEDQQKGLAFGLGVGKNILNGAQGASALIGQIGSAAGVAMFGPAGEALGPLIQTLAQGPDEVAKMIDAFVDAFPTLVENVIEAIPVVIEKLVEKSPTIIGKLAEAIMRGIGTSFQKLFQHLIQTVVEGAAKFVESILNGAVSFIGKLIEGIGDGIRRIFDSINPLGGEKKGQKQIGAIIGGGIGAVVGGPIGAIIGGGLGAAIGGLFADGGVVPDGYPNDSYPARLTSGEVVIPRDKVQNFKQFADSNGINDSSKLDRLIAALENQGHTQVNLVMNEKVLASTLLKLNQRGFRTA